MRTGHRTFGQCIRLQTAFLFHVCPPFGFRYSKLTFAAALRLGLPVNRDALARVTRGLVGDTSFAVLPEVAKERTFLLTFVFQLVCASSQSNCSRLHGTDSSDQIVVPSQLGHLRRRRHALRICRVSFRVARARESGPPDYNPVQLDRAQR